MADAAADWATSGAVALTGRPDGPPHVPPGRAASVMSDLADRFAAATGVVVDGPALLGERAACTGRRRGGTVSVGGATRLLPTADGWAAVSCARPDDPALLGALVGEEIDADPWPAVAAWLRTHPGAELAERAALLGVACGLVSDVPGYHTEDRSRGRRPHRVVDFSALWAGPLCAQLLGLAGAHVIKVETPQRPDGARRGDAAFYRLLHGGHDAVALDPGDPRGRRRLAALVEAADVVIEASRPRALAGFGLDAERAVSRGTTWMTITAWGLDDDRVGFGDDVAAGAGLVAREPDGTPLFCGDALADPLAGLTAAVAAVEDTGRRHDVAMGPLVAATLDGSPGGPAHRGENGWVVDTATGPVPVAVPRARCPRGSAHRQGADTDRVLAGLGIR